MGQPGTPRRSSGQDRATGTVRDAASRLGAEADTLGGDVSGFLEDVEAVQGPGGRR